jgi:predicted SprT family Zn-dependent metalloprotease
VFPRWARTRATILHELAHWITYNVHGSPSQGVAGHGIEFCTVTLHLILHTQGLATHEALRLSYVDHRVLHEPATDERPRTIREIEPIRSATQLRLAV